MLITHLNLQPITLLLMTSLFAGCSFATESLEKHTMLTANGKFEVNLTPQSDDDNPAGRMLISKSYAGDMLGSGIGQMISKRMENGTAVYYAIEEFVGSVDNKNGSFTLLHEGVMTAEEQSLQVDILVGSGTNELSSITGSLEIIQQDGVHSYILSYTL